MINVLINGCNGCMGKVLEACIEQTQDMLVKYKIDKDTLLNFETLSSYNSKPDVIIDFSIPKATFTALDYAVCNLVPIVIATTGFSNDELNKISEYSEAIPIFKASNMSYNINLICNILTKISPLLSNMDIEIVEKHHNRKKDAPSGTAFMLADAINSSAKNKYKYVFDRHSSTSKRTKNEIGISSIRGGNLVGEHSVLFLGNDETIEIKHSAYSRTVYAEGALLAAKFIIDKKNGIYDMTNLINQTK